VWPTGCYEYYSDKLSNLVHIPVMPSEQLEKLADKILGESGFCAPIDAFVMADEYGLSLRPVGPYDEGFVGGEIRFNARVGHCEQQEYVIRCVAREALMRNGVYASQTNIARLARALMLPRRQFDANANFATLVREHPHASFALIGARKGDVFASRRARRSDVTITGSFRAL